MNQRHLRWSLLVALLLFVACGPPEVHDINGGADDHDVGDDTGDDDDAASTFPTATTPPGVAPTLTSVPSFATWNAQVRPLMCVQCHEGSDGGLTFGSQTDAASLKHFWFESICNQDDVVVLDAGMQNYDPATGRFRQYMSGSEPSGHTAIGPNAGMIDAWFDEGAGTTPPSCNDYYDLASSS